MTVIVDYGVGNLCSLVCSFKAIGEDTLVSGDPEEIAAADRILLPGVGAFGDAAEKLKTTGLDVVLKKFAATGKPLMGVCLGMQLLFRDSAEFHGNSPGLGLLKGRIKPIAGVVPPSYKVPQMGWNALNFRKCDCPVFDGIDEGSFVYFVHSFYAEDCDDSLVATCEYGANITAAVAKDNIFGCQFHPEKSGETGLAILKNFCRIGR